MAVAHQDYVCQVLAEDDVENIQDERLHADVCRHQMLALSQARLGRRVDIVTGRPELIGYRLPAPAAMKGAMHENEGRHPRLGSAGHRMTEHTSEIPSLIRN